MKKTPIVMLLAIALILLVAYFASYKNNTLYSYQDNNRSENSISALSALEA